MDTKKENNNKAEKPWTAKECSEYLNVCRAHLYGLLKTTDIPFRRIGRHLFFFPSEIFAWVDKNYNYTEEEKLLKGEK